MNFLPDPTLEDFRQEVRSFLRKSLPADLAHRARGMMSAPPEIARWQRVLYDQGWGAPSWAKAHGGTGWTIPQRLVFEEECVRAEAPTQDVFGQKLLGPVLNEFGTEAQIREHIPAILKGERLWCQGFSEPGSGSDLASLRTAAVREGNDFVVNGQKIWTSYAHKADWIFLLVRTGHDAKKQAGISFLLADIRSPGIRIRPIRSIDGCHHLNEVFLDSVRVPAGNLVGAEGDGWKITKFLLNNEHASTAEFPTLKGYLQKLAQLGEAMVVGDRPLAETANYRLQWVRLEAEVAAISMLVARVAALEQNHDTSPQAQALGSILKIRSTELQQRISEFLVEALGDYGTLAYRGPHDPADGSDLPAQDLAKGVATDMFFRRAATIYGGSSEIQRGIIAKSLFRF